MCQGAHAKHFPEDVMHGSQRNPVVNKFLILPIRTLRWRGVKCIPEVTQETSSRELTCKVLCLSHPNRQVTSAYLKYVNPCLPEVTTQNSRQKR